MTKQFHKHYSILLANEIQNGFILTLIDTECTLVRKVTIFCQFDQKSFENS